MAAAVYDSAGESIDLLQTVRHQTSSASSSSSLPVTSTAQYLPTVVLPTYKVSRRAETSQRTVSNGHGKQRTTLVLPVSGDVSCSGCDDDEEEEDDVYVERATSQHCHCCCHCATQRHSIHQHNVTDVKDTRALPRRRSPLDDDDSDPVSCIERDRLTTSGLYLPPLFVTSVAGRSGAQSGDVTESTSGCREQRTCLSRWWTQVLCRRRSDVARRSCDDDENDDCWRLFPGRHCNQVTSRDTDRRSTAVPGSASLCSSPAAADDAGTSRGGDAVLLPLRCRRRAADAKAARGRCTRVFCIILAGLCVAIIGLLVGALVVASPAALHYSK